MFLIIFVSLIGYVYSWRPTDLYNASLPYDSLSLFPRSQHFSSSVLSTGVCEIVDYSRDCFQVFDISFLDSFITTPSCPSTPSCPYRKMLISGNGNNRQFLCYPVIVLSSGTCTFYRLDFNALSYQFTNTPYSINFQPSSSLLYISNSHFSGYSPYVCYQNSVIPSFSFSALIIRGPRYCRPTTLRVPPISNFLSITPSPPPDFIRSDVFQSFVRDFDYFVPSLCSFNQTYSVNLVICYSHSTTYLFNASDAFVEFSLSFQSYSYSIKDYFLTTFLHITLAIKGFFLSLFNDILFFLESEFPYIVDVIVHLIIKLFSLLVTVVKTIIFSAFRTFPSYYFLDALVISMIVFVLYIYFRDVYIILFVMVFVSSGFVYYNYDSQLDHSDPSVITVDFQPFNSTCPICPVCPLCSTTPFTTIFPQTTSTTTSTTSQSITTSLLLSTSLSMASNTCNCSCSFNYFPSPSVGIAYSVAVAGGSFRSFSRIFAPLQILPNIVCYSIGSCHGLSYSGYLVPNTLANSSLTDIVIAVPQVSSGVTSITCSTPCSATYYPPAHAAQIIGLVKAYWLLYPVFNVYFSSVNVACIDQPATICQSRFTFRYFHYNPASNVHSNNLGSTPYTDRPFAPTWRNAPHNTFTISNSISFCDDPSLPNFKIYLNVTVSSLVSYYNLTSMIGNSPLCYFHISEYDFPMIFQFGTFKMPLLFSVARSYSYASY